MRGIKRLVVPPIHVDAGELALADSTCGRAGTRVTAPADFVFEGTEEGGAAAGVTAARASADPFNVNGAFGGTLETVLSALSCSILSTSACMSQRRSCSRRRWHQDS